MIVFDAKAAAERGGVGWKGIVQLGLRQAAKTLAQIADVAAEAGEVFGDGQRLLGEDEEARGLPLHILEPEHLCQRYRLSVAFVEEAGQQHRIAVAVA